MQRHPTLRSAGLALLLTAAAAVPILGCNSNRADTAPTRGAGLNQHGQIETGSGTNTTTNNGGTSGTGTNRGGAAGGASGGAYGTGGAAGGAGGGSAGNAAGGVGGR